jgi:hypothetical protein
MNPQEIRDKIMAAINGIIKDEPDTPEANLHDVLSAKMQARMTGTPEAPGEASDPESSPTEEVTVTTVADEFGHPIDEPTGA